MGALEEDEGRFLPGLKLDAKLFLCIFLRGESVASVGVSKWSHDLKTLKNQLD